jgi:hypothetical protein
MIVDGLDSFESSDIIELMKSRTLILFFTLVTTQLSLTELSRLHTELNELTPVIPKGKSTLSREEAHSTKNSIEFSNLDSLFEASNQNSARN